MNECIMQWTVKLALMSHWQDFPNFLKASSPMGKKSEMSSQHVCSSWVFDCDKTSPDITSSLSIPPTSSNPSTHSLIYTWRIKGWKVSQGSFGFAMQLFHVNFTFPFSSPQFTLTSCHNIVSLRENNKPKQMCWTHGHQQEQFPSKVSMWNRSKTGMSYPKNNLHLLLLFGGLKEKKNSMSKFRVWFFSSLLKLEGSWQALWYLCNEFLFCWITGT